MTSGLVTPEHWHPTSTYPSPGTSGANSSARAERSNKAQGFVRTGVGMPPKPPGPPTGTPQTPATVQPLVSANDSTPVVSNQNRKSIVSVEEKKEAEDWSASAVKQMSKAVDHLRHFGESFIYDESPSRDSKDGQPRVSQTNSRLSDGGSSFWEKEETFHTDADDINMSELAKEIRNDAPRRMQRTTASAAASSPISPSPPPSILRTAHDPTLVRDVYDYVPGKTGEERVHGQNAGTTSVLSGGPSVDPSSPDNRAMTPMMRMRVPGAQELVLIGDNEILQAPTEDTSVKTPARASFGALSADSESMSPRHSVDFTADSKGPMTPDRSRRSRSSKGRSPGSSTRPSRASRRRRRRRRRHKGGIFGVAAQCEGGIPHFFQSLMDGQCGQFLDEDEGSESTYSSAESERSDGDTYGDSLKSSPPRKASFLDKSNGKRDGNRAIQQERPIDKERVKEKERMLERERAREKELEKERERLERQRLEQVEEERKEKERQLAMEKEKERSRERERDRERVGTLFAGPKILRVTIWSS